ncbi:hypothetical protein CRX42_02320 [Pseudomonas jessenii]|uniref:Uncharacterized protein n=1 Tax=Pseudomonas jessenii TaxID=77298 RepID=A0A2W0EWA8_PSEJE|nr:hypothetical protein [Pseudomonas jessenii]PYY72186.1 hypothetical protein CRX42_02320 [Pseudomonas jessenii]
MPTLQGSYVLESPFVSPDTSLQVAVRDALLRGVANSGVRFIADLGFGYCYPGGDFSVRPAPAAPGNGALVGDVSDHANGSVVLGAGQVIGYAGGGFDYAAITAAGNYLAVPPSVAADIFAAFGGHAQQFMVTAYVKLPLKTNWNSGAALAPMIAWGDANAAAGVADMITIGQSSISSRLEAIRQTVGSTLVSMNVPVSDSEYGQLAQITFWRNAAGTGLSLRTDQGRRTTSGVVGADNTENFSTKTGRLGACNTYGVPSAGGATNSVKWRGYRMFIENLARSGRDPVTVAEDDWLRVKARIAASAAANGGTSQIFN